MTKIKDKLTNVAARYTPPSCEEGEDIKYPSIRISDGGGLFLQIMPNDTKYWRFAYRFGKQQKTLALSKN